MIKSNQINIELTVKTKILLKEDYFQRCIVKKLKISRHEVQYLLPRPLETGANFDRIRAEEKRVTTELKMNYYYNY